MPCFECGCQVVSDYGTGEIICCKCGIVQGTFTPGLGNGNPLSILGMWTNQAEYGYTSNGKLQGLGSYEGIGTRWTLISQARGHKRRPIISRIALWEKRGVREVYARSGKGNILLVASGPEREAEASPASPPPGSPSLLDLPEVLEHYKYCDRHL
jgi:hypothetical protein